MYQNPQSLSQFIRDIEEVEPRIKRVLNDTWGGLMMNAELREDADIQKIKDHLLAKGYNPGQLDIRFWRADQTDIGIDYVDVSFYTRYPNVNQMHMDLDVIGIDQKNRDVHQESYKDILYAFLFPTEDGKKILDQLIELGWPADKTTYRISTYNNDPEQTFLEIQYNPA